MFKKSDQDNIARLYTESSSVDGKFGEPMSGETLSKEELSDIYDTLVDIIDVIDRVPDQLREKNGELYRNLKNVLDILHPSLEIEPQGEYDRPSMGV